MLSGRENGVAMLAGGVHECEGIGCMGGGVGGHDPIRGGGSFLGMQEKNWPFLSHKTGTFCLLEVINLQKREKPFSDFLARFGHFFGNFLLLCLFNTESFFVQFDIF